MITVKASKPSVQVYTRTVRAGGQTFLVCAPKEENLYSAYQLNEDHLEFWEPGFLPLNWKHVRHVKASGVYLHAVGPNVEYGIPGTHLIDSVYRTNGISKTTDGRWIVPAGFSYLYRQSGRYQYVWCFDVSEAGYKVVYNSTNRTTQHGQVVYRQSIATGTTLTNWSEIKKKHGFVDYGPDCNAQTAAVVAAAPELFAQTGYVKLTGSQRVQQPAAKLDEWMIRAKVRHEIHHVVISAQKSLELSLPTLHAQSFDSLNKFDGNMLSFLSEINEFGQTGMKSVIDLIRSEGKISDLASFWLSNRYGDRLSFRDASALVKAIDRTFLTVRPRTTRYVQGKSRCSATESVGGMTVEAQCNCQIAVTPRDSNTLMRAVRHAYEWDYYPSLGNVWDMIPMSFVVDWFINVGEIYESVDRLVQSRYYTVNAVLESVKAHAQSSLLPGITYSFYCRRVRHSLRLGVSSVELGLPSAVNVIDGVSLIVS